MSDNGSGFDKTSTTASQQTAGASADQVAVVHSLPQAAVLVASHTLAAMASSPQRQQLQQFTVVGQQSQARQQLLAHIGQPQGVVNAAAGLPLQQAFPLAAGAGGLLRIGTPSAGVSCILTSPNTVSSSYPTISLSSRCEQRPRTVSATAGGVMLVPTQHTNTASPRLTVVQTASREQVAAEVQKTPISTAIASGGTIHHLGQSPTRGNVLPLANPPQYTSSIMQAQLKTPGSVKPDATGLSPQIIQQRLGNATAISLSTATPTRKNTQSPGHSPERPVRKKIKLEQRPPANEEIAHHRKLICDEKLREMKKIKESYHDNMTELFFLQNSGNLMDYLTWLKRPPSVHLQNMYKSGRLDSDDEDEGVPVKTEIKLLSGTSGSPKPSVTPVAISMTLPPAVSAIKQEQGAGDGPKKQGGRHGMVFGHITQTGGTGGGTTPPHSLPAPKAPGGIPLSADTATTNVGSPPPYTTASSSGGAVGQSSTSVTTLMTATPVTSTLTTTSASSMRNDAVTSILGAAGAAAVVASTITPGGVLTSPSGVRMKGAMGFKSHKSPQSGIYENSLGSQEAIVERAKQEAQVLQRVTELRKDGMWSAKRLPKVMEPPRPKAHWDYLLEEMQWLAADFAQERKWKKAGARKIARMVTKHFQELQQKEQKAEKEESLRLKRTANNMGKMVREFWSNIEKVVQYKQQSRLEEKRKKALDLHLSFIVEQTAKYSTWLTEGLGGSSVASSSPAHSHPSADAQDNDFEPSGSASDDEETIAKEEMDGVQDEASVLEEINELEKESQLPIEELLRTLPAEVLAEPARIPSEDEEEEDEASKSKDLAESEAAPDDYKADEGSDDDEETIEREEKLGQPESYNEELTDLQNEGDMSIEELRKKYAGAYKAEFEEELPSDNSAESDMDDESETEEEEEDEEEDEEEETEEEEEKGEEEEEMDTKCLVEGPPVSAKDPNATGPDGITDIAATAESIQPTGYTLETTKVRTVVPFLLKHTLREYQHVGLDWLATMNERKLNGILADEMGLGKTIQTIALLAHLACEKGIWGPHLIVVPTSVMLNWELELKKWCPAFKILTYYGTLKERKLKRTGWTKTNAFHVCITSYKLVIQDHQAFRRKKWKYLILDEAQNIKNFKSQRWQTLLNFSSQRRLLLTGTPLQNSLMELWSLMHFLMPHVFASHREFKEWFSNPLSGMIEGSHEYNEGLIRRLHKVLRPFLLRRLKADVEKQMPKKYEHVIMCHLSKRQRFLYEDFMSRTKTKETLSTGHFMSVINILMQLRKVCNHPNLFDPRPITSPYAMEGLVYHTPSLVLEALKKDPLNSISPEEISPSLCDLELSFSRWEARRVADLKTSSSMITEIDNQPECPSRPPPSSKPIKLPHPASLSSSLTSLSGRMSPMLSDGRPLSSPATPAFSLLSHSSSSDGVSPKTISSRHMTPILTQLSQQTVMNGPSITTIASSSSVSTTTVTTTMGSLGTRPSTSVLLPSLETQSALDRPIMRVAPMSSVMQKRGSMADDVTDSMTRRKSEGLYHLPQLEQKQKCNRAVKLERLARYNCCRCSTISPVYGRDLCSSLYVPTTLHCLKESRGAYWKLTHALSGLLHTPEECLQQMNDIVKRYVFAVPVASSPGITQRVCHPHPSDLMEETRREYVLRHEVAPKAAFLHTLSSQMSVQFPELRLIQYDCGKLQTLSILLRQLKTGSHRVLLFTQMTRMLDVLEAFLNYHGHRYLRLDGTTRVEQRQALMDRFNADSRIFVFILSTRSGGLGINLTGADTVVFYDSDWNPTMDAQAQDRCHRIGQTRDVHIYRLISERTIEENILKKANQKRLLGNVAIEGGNFTTAFFKEQTIKDLFAEPSGLDSLVTEVSEKPVTAVTPVSTSKEVVKRRSLRTKAEPQDPTVAAKTSDSPTPITQDEMEQALCAAEEDTDIQAAKVVKAEQRAELAEFDETIPWDEKEAELKAEDEQSRVERELKLLEKELTPVERYAVVYMECQMAPVTSEELEQADAEVTIAKEEWELSRLQALREEEEIRAEIEEDEMLFTYSRDDAYNKVFVSETTGEHMPMWCPPTPPQDDNDLYIDHTLCFLYEPSTMTESQLPSVYVKKEHKRIRMDPALAVARKMKPRKEEHPRVPRSLFDRPRRDARLMKGLGMNKFQKSIGQSAASLVSRTPLMDSVPDQPEWLVHEDWALLQALQTLQELPLNLQANSPAHIPNWDLVADVVNIYSRTYRSPKQCRNRYENTIVPREEGKILYDINPRKQKKSKGIYKTKNNRPMRTSQLHGQDNNGAITTLFTLHFDSIKAIAAKRPPPLRHTLASPTLKNPKHAAVLLENGIIYEQPLTPVQVATIRAERIAKEKKANQAGAQQAAEQQASLARSQTTTSSTPATQPTVVSAPSITVTAITTSITPTPQMTIVQTHPAAVSSAVTLHKPSTAVAAVSLARSLAAGTSSIVVNAPPGAVPASTFTTINKRQSVVTTTISQQQQQLAAAVRSVAARGGTTAMTVQELQAAVNNPRAQVPLTQVISSAASTSQILAAQKPVTVAVSAATGTLGQQLTHVPTKTLTPQQFLQLSKQQNMLKQQQQQLRQARLTSMQVAQQGGQIAVSGTQSIHKTVGAPLITSITPAQMSQATSNQTAHLQVTKPVMKQIQRTDDMAFILKRQQQQQQLQHTKVASLPPGTVSQTSAGQTQLTRLTAAAQLITGTQMQQVSGTTAGGQPVTAIVKTMTTQGGGNPTVPLSLGSITVNVPHQKTLTVGKALGQTIRFQQQMTPAMASAQRKATFTAQQKLPAGLSGHLQQVKAAGGSTPLIIPQQQQTSLPKVMVQQIASAHVVKQGGLGGVSQGTPTIQQLVTTPTLASSTQGATVITAPLSQLVTQAAKINVPAGAVTTSIQQLVRSSSASILSAGATSNSPITFTQSNLVNVKHVQELVPSPQKTLTIPQPTTMIQGTTQQVKVGTTTLTRPQSLTQNVQVLQQQSTIVKQHLATQQQQQQQQAQLASSNSAQQAAQQVLQQAQAQAQTVASASQLRPAGTASVVAVSTATGSVGATVVAVTSVPGGLTATHQSATQQGTTDAAKVAATYAIRTRNTRPQ